MWISDATKWDNSKAWYKMIHHSVHDYFCYYYYILLFLSGTLSLCGNPVLKVLKSNGKAKNNGSTVKLVD